MATPVDFPKYLQSLVESYKKQQHLYTLTDLQVEVRVEITPEDRSQFLSSKKKPETKIDRLEVLAGLRKYVQQGNVLLVGKPGSGKSTVLQRFRWELALEALKEGDRPIPVLVQLRGDSLRPTDGLVAISRDRAEGILECWLRDRGVLDAPTKAKEWLEDLLEHPDPEIRQSSAIAIGKLGNEALIPVLIRLLEDSNAQVRESAVDALGNVAQYRVA
jgi:Mrp family chromosome partitioning ATPase